MYYYNEILLFISRSDNLLYSDLGLKPNNFAQDTLEIPISRYSS
jgi:hypothetical protein